MSRSSNALHDIGVRIVALHDWREGLRCCDDGNHDHRLGTNAHDRALNDGVVEIAPRRHRALRHAMIVQLVQVNDRYYAGFGGHAGERNGSNQRRNAGVVAEQIKKRWRR